MEIDLGDYFQYTIGPTSDDLTTPLYGGIRLSIKSYVADREFVPFKMDISFDVVPEYVEEKQGEDWLDFIGIPSPTFSLISLEQHLAEKSMLSRCQEHQKILVLKI